MLYLGACIGYWQGNIKLLVDDLAALKPTFFVGVPRVFDRVRQRVLERVRFLRLHLPTLLCISCVFLVFSVCSLFVLF